MKKIFTLFGAVALATASFAQTQSAFVNNAENGVEGLTKETAIALSGGTVVASSDNVTMKLAFDDSYQESSLYGSSDIANQVVIDGTIYDLVKGIQGETNPTPANITDGGQSAGAVFQFDVTTDGVLYVIGKYTGNKQYYVWEGDVPNGLGMPVAYTFVGQPSKVAGVVSVTLPGNEYGYYTVGSGYDNGTAIACISQCIDYGKGLTTVDEQIAAGVTVNNTYGTTWASAGGNALGVIAFPVYADAATYYVNATGSKLTADGFVFVPGATSVGSINFAKDGELVSDGINEIAADKANVNAPIFNLAGQQVSKAYKGVVIQNGQKFIQK